MRWQQRLYFYSLLFFVLLLPFQPKTPPIVLGVMVATLLWLITFNFKEKFKQLFAQPPALYIIAYFVWCVIGLLYSNNTQEGTKDVFQKLPFLLFGLILGSMPLFVNRAKPALIKVFLISCGAICVFSFGAAYVNFQQTGDALSFNFSKLTITGMVPPHYLGMYLNFGYGILLYNILRGKAITTRFIDVFLAVLFFVTIIFLSVRMQYAVFIAVNILVVWRYSAQRKGSLVAWLSVLVLIGIFSSIVLAIPGSRRRVIDTVHEAISFKKVVNYRQTNHRKFLWAYGWEVVQEKPLLGYGTGASDEMLHQSLQQSDAKFWDGKNTYFIRDIRYNYHNEYLQQLATHGTVGLVILLVMLLVPLLGFQLNYQAKIFLVVSALSFITESMLQRQAGILFFSFFYALLITGTGRQKVVSSISESE